MPAGKLSLVLQLGAALDTRAPMAGLWIDEWTEVVPNAEETTALAFQFDLPDACAPRVALLAVPPVPGEAWTVGGVYRALVETLDFAKLRAIDAEALADIAQYLPGLFVAFNAKGDVASTDLAALTNWAWGTAIMSGRPPISPVGPRKPNDPDPPASNSPPVHPKPPIRPEPPINPRPPIDPGPGNGGGAPPVATTASVTSWTQLVPHCRDAEMIASVSARVYNPLWMLTRQWQLGEFQGEGRRHADRGSHP